MAEVRKIGVDDISYVDFTSPAGVSVRGVQPVDVRAYGAVGDGTTDDTTAIQAAINAGGDVYFPPGIYAISSTLNLHTASEYRGPRGGTVSSGDSGPQTGRGAAIKWIGADNATIINMEGTYNSVWEGIDIFGDTTDVTSAALASTGLTGIRLHSVNSPSSQRNVISNVRIWNVNTGIRVGGLDAASYSYQTDGWVIEKFWIYTVNTGIYINGGNANQYSIIRNGSVGQFIGGINIYDGSYMGIKDITFSSLQSPPAGSANIILRLPRVLTIERTQGEPQVGTTWPHVRFTAGATGAPVTLLSNHMDGGMQIDNSNPVQNIISIGNTYNTDNVTFTGESAQFTSIGDYFTTGTSIVDSGTNNLITEINNYYQTGGPVAFRKYFNNVQTWNHEYNSVDFKSAYSNLTIDSATPSVLAKNNFRTANTVPTTITNFTNGVEGQRIFVLANDANTTIDFTSSSIRGNAGVDNTLASGDWIDCTKVGDYWYCLLGKWQ